MSKRIELRLNCNTNQLLQFIGLVICLPSLLSSLVHAQSIDISSLPMRLNFAGIHRLDTGDRYIVGGEGSFEHIDPNGTRFTRKLADADLNSVYFVDPDYGWVVGSSGTLMSTSDGGINWKTHDLTVGSDLNDIACNSATNCTAVGDLGTILVTDDGEEWKRVKSQTNNDLESVSLTDTGRGWIVGKGMTVLHLVGADHRLQNVDLLTRTMPNPKESDTNLTTVHFASEEVGWIVSQDSIFSTENSGKKWFRSTLRNVIGIASSDDGKSVFAIRSDGCNYFSLDSGKSWLRFDSCSCNASNSTQF